MQIQYKDADNKFVVALRNCTITDGTRYSSLGGCLKLLPGQTLADFRELPFGVDQEKIAGSENIANKVTTIDEHSTNTQYPSAAAVYNFVGDINQELEDRLDG